MKITSYGAALEVTGSQHLLEVNGKKILMDCGLFQGHRKLAFEKNQHFAYDPASVDVLLVSHAHIDHTGNIPHLVKEGFKGVIYCTEATKSLCLPMLLDSAYIQEQDAKYFSRKLKNSALSIEPIYDAADVEHTLEQFHELPYDTKYKLYDGIYVTFHEAGHVLGSSMIALDILDQEDGKQKRLVFTGDLGRDRLPIINDPYDLQMSDYLLIESTYGNRKHAPIEEGVPELARVINRTVKRGGKIIIPSFAFERTQELIYSIHLLIDQKEIPTNLPIFIDSPLATHLTDVFKQHIELYDEDIRENFRLGQNPFDPRQLKHTNSVEESKNLNFFIGPCIIISSSGMCEAGRIRHHLKNNIEDPKNTIAIVGYMAENTLGRKLVDGAEFIKIFDQMYKVNAEVVILESFSAHADKDDLDEFIKRIKGLKKIMLVHGEPTQSEAFAERIKTYSDAESIVMEPEKSVKL
ncbi:MBL fold metallo-hydrolase [Patescibacteria group bacterium]|nr:MBL fold metallo-hydrolase [Patescibacteria group bacterium]MBU1015727.1 MBL fold metallo-hydrolase [Patescibacteria group bacterium]MBU1684899.1 MBL fold metallo-hydrolase [Patescibacteria group bacterium]MBU1938643.1 MBL fold metallo-hydrolase [Patescibacteria group bacterium]